MSRFNGFSAVMRTIAAVAISLAAVPAGAVGDHDLRMEEIVIGTGEGYLRANCCPRC